MKLGSIVLALALCASGCGVLGGRGVTWPKIAECLAPAAEDLVAQVIRIIARGGDAKRLDADGEAALEALAVKYGPDAVACALKQAVEPPYANDRTASSYRGIDEDAARRGEHALSDRGVWGFSK